MLLRRENTNLQIVNAFCNIEQQAVREETEALRAAMPQKSWKKQLCCNRQMQTAKIKKMGKNINEKHPPLHSMDVLGEMM